MKHRVYSKPIFFDKEGELLNQLFEMGLPCLHLRKPQANEAACRTLLRQIKPQFYNRIVLHQQFELLETLGLKGIHLTESTRRDLTKEQLTKLIQDCHQKKRIIGTAIHRKKDLVDLPAELDYITLSPIFLSISKQNYLPEIDWKTADLAQAFQWVALGGIGLKTLALAYEKGFREVAFLGAIWKDLSMVGTNYELLCRKIKEIDLMD